MIRSLGSLKWRCRGSRGSVRFFRDAGVVSTCRRKGSQFFSATASLCGSPGMKMTGPAADTLIAEREPVEQHPTECSTRSAFTLLP